MKADVILELMDGTREEAMLAQPFIPEENEINVTMAKTGNVCTAVPLDDVCCVLMAPKAQQITYSSKEQTSEEVITTTDKHFHVSVLKDQQTRSGFYGLSTDMGSPYKLIFFTNHGLKVRTEKRHVGEILEEKGVVTRHSIDATLEEQKKLRKRRLGEIIAEEHDLPLKMIENVINNAYKEGKVKPRMKVGEILAEAGLVTREQVEDALASQELGKKKRIGTLLIENGLITENQLLMALAVKFRLRFVDLKKEAPKESALKSLPVDAVYKFNVLPLDDDGKRIIVATSEPTDYTIQHSLYLITRRQIEMVVATPKQISEAILQYYPKKEYRAEEIINGLTTENLEIEPEERMTDVEVEISESDSQIVALVNRILLDGYNKGASDIHFEPSTRGQPVQVRYRIDGMCRVIHQIPMMYKRAIISRIKIMSDLDISERRRPQSGKIIVRYQGKQIEYRVEITPTVSGNEDAVLRILASSEPLPLENMGFSHTNLKSFKEILSRPYGIILCVGPTGSGKTTSLHSALKYLNKPEVKIWTVEDPVEITQQGLRQVQVQSKIGLTFQEVLRSFLRADPDVIMVGEMRDPETAKTGIEASLTGHLVLSTLHTNSAPETVVRLIEMGIEPFNFADALLGILAQRLIRRLCNRCKESYHPDMEEYNEIVQIYDPLWFQQHNGELYSEKLSLMRKVGCEACNGSGYKGRIAVHELLVNTENLKQLIRRNSSVDELRALAIKEGMRTLLMDGVQKVLQGFTDIGEILPLYRYEKID